MMNFEELTSIPDLLLLDYLTRSLLNALDKRQVTRVMGSAGVLS